MLDSLSAGIFSSKENWILDADIRSFFDEVRQEWLLRFLEHRINDANRSKFIDLETGFTLVLMGRRLGDEITLTSGFAKHSKRRPARLDRGEAYRVGTTLSAADPMADHCPLSGEAIQQTTETRR